MRLLKEIRAVDVLPIYLEGGTTRPVVVVGDDGNQYVLKVFKKVHTSQRCYTGAEVVSYFMAKEFSINIPDAVLITVPSDLINLIDQHNPTMSTLLKTKDLSKPCFGSKYHEGLILHSPSLLDKYLDLDELETIFAFDTLILNGDRKKTKPNILRDEANYMLIDHDQAFEGYMKAPEFFNSNNLLPYSSDHIFYDMLKKRESKNNDSVKFETFEYYLRSIRTRKIKLQISRLAELGYGVGECYDWINYIESIKNNYTNFVNVLKQNIKN
jgi:hypothetical protein